MSGQAVAAPIAAFLTQVLSPLFGWIAMFLIIAGAWIPHETYLTSNNIPTYLGCSLACAILQCRFPRYPSPRTIMDRLSMSPSQLWGYYLNKENLAFQNYLPNVLQEIWEVFINILKKYFAFNCFQLVGKPTYAFVTKMWPFRCCDLRRWRLNCRHWLNYWGRVKNTRS